MYKIINAVSSARVPTWGNGKKYIAVHYLGVDGQNHDLDPDGCGAHYYVYWDGTIYQRCSHDAIVWQVGTAGYYTQKHPIARNANTIGIEMCCHCDGNKSSAEDPKWWFTKETQEATAWLVRKLMSELNIPIENVLRHFDIVNKTCPAPYVHNNKYRGTWTWNEFLEKVKNANYQPSEDPQPTGATPYRIRKSWKDAGSQLGAYYSLENAKSACPEGYGVYDATGKEMYRRAPKVVTTDNMTAKDLNGLSEAEKIEKVAPIYQEVMKETGMLASVGLAQFCLESGFGTTDLAQNANNMHGMKCSLSGNTWAGSTWDGTSKYTKQTAEQTKDGRTYYVTADFRKYPSIKKSVQDRAAYFIGAMNGSSLRYPNVNKIQNAEEQIRLLKAGGYATDVKYVDKLMNLVGRFDLTKYDKGIAPDKWKEKDMKSDPLDVYIVCDSLKDGKPVNQIGAYRILTNATRVAGINNKKVYDITTGKQIWPIETAPATSVQYYRVTTDYRDGKYLNQHGAYTSQNNALTACRDLGMDYKVYDPTGKVIYPTTKPPDGVKHPTVNTSVTVGVTGTIGKIISACQEMDAQVKKDISNGHIWTYTNKKSMGRTFEISRSSGYYRTNCNKGVIWALIKAGVIPSDFSGNFYYNKGKLCGNQSAKDMILKKYKEISGGGKKVSALIKNGTLQAGDILGFGDMTHTAMYLGNDMWLDTGHANCSGSGEGAKFRGFVCKTPYPYSPVTTILRPDSRPQYRVQCGEFVNLDYCVKMVTRMGECGFDASVVKYGSTYVAQAGVFSIKANADALSARIKDAGLPVVLVIM